MHSARELLTAYVKAHNAGFRSGDFEALGELLLPTASMRFHGIEIGPFDNAKAILQAFCEQPPDDEVLAVLREIGPGQPEEAHQRRLLAIRSNDPAIYNRVVEGKRGPDWDPEAVLAAIASPTLLMQADPDFGAALLDEHAEKAMRILTNAEHVKFPGVGHGIHSTVTQETVDVMERFVRERGPAGA